jgi:hypothetical protein
MFLITSFIRGALSKLTVENLLNFVKNLEFHTTILLYVTKFGRSIPVDNSVTLVRQQTIRTEQPSLVDEVRANFFG